MFRRFASRFVCLIFGLLFLASDSSRAQESPTAPTVGTDPAVLDQQWQAGNGKYDEQRKKVLDEVERVSHAGPYRPDYESLDNYQVPGWYKDAKFGIFIHWGVYSVPAFGSEWYPREMYTQGSDVFKHHVATYGPQDKFGYKDFIPMFKGEKFDPQAWAHLFKESGAKYVVPVLEHHDGFAMYDSGLSDWTAAKMGPHRDTGGELAKQFVPRGCILARRPTAWSITSSWVKGGSSIQTSMIRNMLGSMDPLIHGSSISTIRRSIMISPGYRPPMATTGWRGRRRSWRSIIPISCTSTGGSASRGCAIS